jgi:hypothetical protein
MRKLVLVLFLALSGCCKKDPVCTSRCRTAKSNCIEVSAAEVSCGVLYDECITNCPCLE